MNEGPLDDQPAEFAHVNDALVSRPARFGYTARFGSPIGISGTSEFVVSEDRIWPAP